MTYRLVKSALSVSILSLLMSTAYADDSVSAENSQSESESELVTLNKIVVTAEDQLKQSLGVSTISQEDLDKLPVVNDISEYVRRMPGVNLTGNGTSGARGNNRQIDIRGMGPENTLILVDGKPVSSRNSVRYGWRGERDTRGDSNWVPADAIESIEVIRGPAAARYGNGAMGGVVNIVTKKVTDELHGSLEVFANQPEDSKEGASRRVGFDLSGPIIPEVLGFRLYGNYNKTDADAADINPLDSDGYRAAGREGVKNQDIAGRLSWIINDQQSLTADISSGRQGNEYTGDAQNNNVDASNPGSNALINSLVGTETNTMYRNSYALTHDGKWDWGTSKLIAQYDNTKNKRVAEGLAGGPEGRPSSSEKKTSELETFRLSGEANIPFDFYIPHVLTLGTEWVKDDFTDPASTTQSDLTGGQIVDGNSNRSKMKSEIYSAYIEDNMKLTERTDLVLSLRYDDHDKSGDNWSPGLSITHQLGDYFTLKGGIAKAYKAPNMYQNSPGYLLYTKGNGCPIASTTLDKCYLLGNADLKPETSINKEIGVQFQKDNVNASLTWFRNDYKDKIAAGTTVEEQVTVGSNVYNVLKWTNIPEALIQGIEGSVSLDFDNNINWTNNFTYMMDSKDKTTGNQLSIIPIYTINSIFNYQINDQWDTNFVFTQYGRQKPRQIAVSNSETSGLNLESLKSYSTSGINFGYKHNDHLKFTLGVSNIFDKQIFRDSNSNSQTYNEPGRAYYASVKTSF
ncbi:TonB-dependent siderophore receptor [Acinetobacter gerneri]|uniref:TonB-dependent siderophore receptor n=1 Tax=Acinetobacter gerneri TaxID=202952 RepID=A0AAW8JEY8_9GAMM|nr:TonB-dependent siderophore receptor [Acinetobacter gerneri]MDQ9009764.1 TonB-dependent siderophore receptor [Acinetobacter gerneri]MDQ9013736.1 TonB-dependent siderophore receptor [Acinetobacter gerneri]MDQ9025150.1 TonB-dependent siderophore receptor [Acinetobacter gerneri]MDQ9050913.1 TonB-dependent siderophore receptor [Acinetobacter gerneri]MDQ9059735.1 TonB-dependent siderophore receptor [Acinetobacter gerneri]